MPRRTRATQAKAAPPPTENVAPILTALALTSEEREMTVEEFLRSRHQKEAEQFDHKVDEAIEDFKKSSAEARARLGKKN